LPWEILYASPETEAKPARFRELGSTLQKLARKLDLGFKMFEEGEIPNLVHVCNGGKGF
jgi:hypothetical protein